MIQTLYMKRYGRLTKTAVCFVGLKNTMSTNVFAIIPFTKKTEMQNTGPNSRTTTAEMALAIRAR